MIKIEMEDLVVFHVLQHQCVNQGIFLILVLIFLHLGLLIWEMRYVSATLSYPGLKPRIKRQKKKKSIG